MLDRMSLKFGLTVFATVFALQAGPPLLCHPYNIGSAASLPWGSNASTGWENPDASYNLKQLSADTLKLLDASAPVLVRMETLRRATIYGEKDHGAAAELLSNLKKRASEGSNGLAMFDYGYYVESLKEMQWKYKDDITAGVDGSRYVNKAMALMPEAADIRLAAERIKSGKPQAGNARAY
jgi:hypothetical protein